MEIWSPAFDLTAKARGAAVLVRGSLQATGSRIRDHRHVRGCPWLPVQTKIRLRLINKQIIRMWKRCQSLLSEKKFFAVMMPSRNWAWAFEEAHNLAGSKIAGQSIFTAQFALCCFGG